MNALRTAILEHTTATGVHHDWLIEDPTLPNPAAPDARLWTARVAPPPQDWPSLQRFDLTVIPPHRRAYLDYQGPVSGNRGYIRRLAHGMCQASIWSTNKIVLSLQSEQVYLVLQLTRLASDRWVAVVVNDQAASDGLAEGSGRSSGGSC